MPGFGSGLLGTIGPALAEKQRQEGELKMTQKLHDMQQSWESLADLHEKIYDAKQNPDKAKPQEVAQWAQRYKYEEEKLNKMLSGSKPLKELWGKVSGVARQALRGPQKQQQPPEVVPQAFNTGATQAPTPEAQEGQQSPLPAPRTGGGIPKPVERGGDVTLGAPDTSRFSLPPPEMTRRLRGQDDEKFKMGLRIQEDEAKQAAIGKNKGPLAKETLSGEQQLQLEAKAQELGKPVESLTPVEARDALVKPMSPADKERIAQGKERIELEKERIAQSAQKPGSVEEQELKDYLAKHPGKGPMDFAAAKAMLSPTMIMQNTPTPEILQGSKEFKVAQDLAYGKLTMGQFRSLYSYSRDANKRAAIYEKATELNPNFNPASFEMGYGLAKNPRVQQQLASLDNVQLGVPDLIKFSDMASRSGATILNKAIIPGGVAIGGKNYSNFKTARTAFADELSGALGYGSATDMSREMGFSMTDENLSPENFKSAIQNVIIPFVERKRDTLLKQMGRYGEPDMNPGATPSKQPDKPTAAPQEGQIMMYRGQKVKIVKINPDGTAVTEPVLNSAH